MACAFLILFVSKGADRVSDDLLGLVLGVTVSSVYSGSIDGIRQIVFFKEELDFV